MQGGAALYEAAVMLPFLLVVLTGLADIAILSTSYIGLNQVSRETVITGADLPSNLFQGQNANLTPTLQQYEMCLSIPTSGCGHIILQWRARRMVESNRMNPTQLELETNLDGSNEVLSAKIQGKFTTILRFLSAVTVHGSAYGPHLED
jgi:hypothetical protein